MDQVKPLSIPPPSIFIIDSTFNKDKNYIPIYVMVIIYHEREDHLSDKITLVRANILFCDTSVVESTVM